MTGTRSLYFHFSVFINFIIPAFQQLYKLILKFFYYLFQCLTLSAENHPPAARASAPPDTGPPCTKEPDGRYAARLRRILLSLVGTAPDVHLLRVLDQLLPEVGVGDADESLGPLPGGQALQVDHAVLRDHIVAAGAGIGADGALGQGGDDAALDSAVLAGDGGGHADEALELFLANNRETTKKLAEKMNEYNSARQQVERKIYDEAVQEIIMEKDKPAIVIGKEGWHHGVAGIVSSKITDEYFKPSILICFDGDEGKGSGRSIPGFDLHLSLIHI